jgi:hypothetical protein
MIDFRALFKLWLEAFTTPRDNAFYPFECAYFSRAFSQLGPLARAKLELQLAAINRVQRIDQGKMVNIYRIKSGKSAFHKHLALHGLGEDIKFFRADIKSYEFGNSTLQVEVFIVIGYIFEIQYSESPRLFFDGSPKTDQFFVSKIDLLIDSHLLEEAAR